MQLLAKAWTKDPRGTSAASTFTALSNARNDSYGGYFTTFRLGIGGPCASRFTPQAAYWSAGIACLPACACLCCSWHGTCGTC